MRVEFVLQSCTDCVFTLSRSDTCSNGNFVLKIWNQNRQLCIPDGFIFMKFLSMWTLEPFSTQCRSKNFPPTPHPKIEHRTQFIYFGNLQFISFRKMKFSFQRCVGFLNNFVVFKCLAGWRKLETHTKFCQVNHHLWGPVVTWGIILKRILERQSVKLLPAR